jgi:DNA-binding transcriptional LysR family regulator
MDLWQLAVFRHVVELKSFSKAARAVHLSQPTVSSHIKDLEEHVGARLIDRLGREALPTQAGRILYDYALRLLALREEAQTALAQHQGKLRGSLVVGGSTIPGGYILPAVIGRFNRQYPRVRLSLSVADTAEIVAAVAAGALELAVVGAESAQRAIIQEKLVDDRLRLIVPAGHPFAGRGRIAPSELAREPFIVRERGSGTLAAVRESLARAGAPIEEWNIVAELGSTEAVRQGVKCGLGVSILSTLAVADELDRGTLCALELEGVALTRSFYLTRHRQRSPSPLAEAFIELLKAHAGAVR